MSTGRLVCFSSSLLLFCIALGLAAIPLSAQSTINTTWTDLGGNWTNASDWSCNCVPNNSSANVFSVTIPSGLDEGGSFYPAGVSLDNTSSPSRITINSLSTDGALQIEDGASLSVTGDLTNTFGDLYVDDRGPGGSTLHVGGNLTSGNMQIGNYNGATLPTTVTVAKTFTGQVNLVGGAAGAQALLSMGGVAPSTLTDSFSLLGRTGGAAVEYGSGQITQIGGSVTLEGPNVFMELSSAPGSNSALTGLQTIGSYGYLDLGGVSLHTTGALTNYGTLVSSGAVGDTLSLGDAMTNSGFILFDNRVSGVELRLNVDGDLTNGGSIELDLTQGSVTGNISNAGTLIVGVFGASASLRANNFSNLGSVYVAPQAANAASASLAVNGYRQTSGSTTVDGTLMAPTVDIAGGKLLGRGIVTGNLVNGAIIAPSTAAVPNVFPSPYNTPGKLTINGDYAQNADGTLVIDIASATDFSMLDVSGKASLGGTADFDFMNGYIPAPNTDFAFLKGGSVAGDFTTLEFTNLYGCTTCTFNLTTLSLDIGNRAPSAVPEPGTLLLFGTGLLGLAALLRSFQHRRHRLSWRSCHIDDQWQPTPERRWHIGDRYREPYGLP